MARLGETSVVIAIRDWQWMNRSAKDQFPDTYLALSGNAEARLGDAAIKHGERLFLFEVKSTREQIDDEWRIRTDKEQKVPNAQEDAAQKAVSTPSKRRLKAEDGTKLAFSFSKNLLEDCAPFTGNEKRWATLLASFQAHHFIYWHGKRLPNTPSPGHLVLQPYLAGIVSRSPALKALAESFSSKLMSAFAYPPLPEDEETSIRFLRRNALPLDWLNGQRARAIISAGEHQPKHVWHHLGLELTEFQSYVMELCGGHDHDEEINVVVLSSQGSYMAHLTKVSELRTIFEPNEPDPEYPSDHSEIVRMELAEAGSTHSFEPNANGFKP